MYDDGCDVTVHRKMTDLTRAFAAGDAVLTKVTTGAVEVIAGVDAAGVVMIEEGKSHG